MENHTIALDRRTAAQKITAEILELQSRTAILAVEIGGKLLNFYENEQWKDLGFDHPDTWIKESGILLRRTTIYNLMTVYKAYQNLRLKCEMAGGQFPQEKFYSIPYSKILAVGKDLDGADTPAEIESVLDSARLQTRRNLLYHNKPVRIHAHGNWTHFDFTHKRATITFTKFMPDISPETLRSLFLSKKDEPKTIDIIIKVRKPRKETCPK